MKFCPNIFHLSNDTGNKKATPTDGFKFFRLKKVRITS